MLFARNHIRNQTPLLILGIFLFLFLTSQSVFGQEVDLGSVDTVDYLTDSIGLPITTDDTVYYSDGEVAGIGNVILKKDSSKSDLKYGLWSEYHTNGVLKSKGNYAVDWLWFCSSGPRVKYYNHKVDFWSYYYDNSVVNAEGVYQIKSKEIRAGGCDADALCSFINKSWVIKNKKGEKIRATRKLNRELNCIGCY